MRLDHKRGHHNIRRDIILFTACRTHPERTLYLAFGHDEEVGGDLGAGAIASLLASRGVTLDFVVDEGGPILVDGLPSLLRTPTQIALVGTAEKVRHGLCMCKGSNHCSKRHSLHGDQVETLRCCGIIHRAL